MNLTGNAVILSATGLAMILALTLGCNTVGDLYDETQQQSGCTIVSKGDGTCMSQGEWLTVQKTECTSVSNPTYPDGEPKMYSPCAITDSSGGQATGYAYAQFVCCTYPAE